MCVIWVLEMALGCGLQDLRNKVKMCIDTKISKLIYVLGCSSGNQHHAQISSNAMEL
jgi:hypothetical protein